MKVWINRLVRGLISAGLLLQLTGSLPFDRAAAAAPVETGGRELSASGEGSLLGYFTAGDGPAQTGDPGGEPPPALPPVAELPPPEPLPLEPVSDEPPPALEPGGPYYAAAVKDGHDNLINTDVGGTIAADTLWTAAGSP